MAKVTQLLLKLAVFVGYGLWMWFAPGFPSIINALLFCLNLLRREK